MSGWFYQPHQLNYFPSIIDFVKSFDQGTICSIGPLLILDMFVM